MSSNPGPDPWRVPGNNQPVEASNRTLNGDPAQSTTTLSKGYSDQQGEIKATAAVID